MKSIVKYLVLVLSTLFSCNINATEIRCGWLNNPTPANVWLIDHDESWNISTQGSASLDDDSMDKVFEAMKDQNEFVRTNGEKGFSCACLTVDADEKAHTIVKVYKAKQLPLKQCLEDMSISKIIPLPSE